MGLVFEPPAPKIHPMSLIGPRPSVQAYIPRTDPIEGEALRVPLTTD